MSVSDEAFTQDGLILVPPILFSRGHGDPCRLNLLHRFRSAFKLAFAIPFTYKLDPE